MQIKRHWFLVETMPFEYFFSGVYTISGSCSSGRLRGACPMGSPRRLAVVGLTVPSGRYLTLVL